MWDYMKYLIYLDSKQKSQFDGGELFVQERFLRGFSDWIPSNRSLYLGKKRCYQDLLTAVEQHDQKSE